MKNRIQLNGLALLVAAASTTVFAMEDESRSAFCDVDSVPPRDAAVLQTLGARDFIDLIVNLQTVDRFSHAVEKNTIIESNVSIRDGIRTIRVDCPGGGNMTTTRLSYSGSYQEAVKVIENCVLHDKTYNGSYSSIHVPTKYSEIVNIYMTSESTNGTVVSVADAGYKLDFADHYFSADYDGVKTYEIGEMSKVTTDGDDYKVSNFHASVRWEDRYQDTSQLQTSFNMETNEFDGGVSVITETPLIIDGNSGGVRTGKIVLNELNDVAVDNRQVSIGRSEIDFSNSDQTVNACATAKTLLRYNSL